MARTIRGFLAGIPRSIRLRAADSVWTARVRDLEEEILAGNAESFPVNGDELAYSPKGKPPVGWIFSAPGVRHE